MIVKTLLAAMVAGLIAGVFMTAAQQARVVPLILHAEEYEGQEPAALTPGTETPATGQTETHEHSSLAAPSFPSDIIDLLSPVTPAYAHEGETHEEGGIMFGMSRFSGTLMANLVAGAGFGLLLAGVSILIGRPVTLSNGALWGAFGWLAVHLLPAIGLPPELPGFPAAELGDRQVWWVATILLSSAGLYLVVLRPEIAAKIIGLVLMGAPHVYGAPQPADIASAVPAVLGAEFAVAALATTLAFWIVLGLVSGFLNDRLAKTA
jgi:cobalt transporter subunit CbtA